MTTANLCAALEPLTLPLSPFAGLPLRHLTSVEGDNVSRKLNKRAPSRPPGRDAVRTSYSDRCAVELGDREPVEILPRVVIALVAKKADGRGFTEQQSGIAIRPPMNPREVAC